MTGMGICRQALEMGLQPEQLLLLEEFAKKLRNGGEYETDMEVKTVALMRRRIRVLEERLAQLAAWADLPHAMRGTLLLLPCQVASQNCAVIASCGLHSNTKSLHSQLAWRSGPLVCLCGNNSCRGARTVSLV
jgi:hypothetical protein